MMDPQIPFIFENQIYKSAYIALQQVRGKSATQCLLDISFIRFPSKCIRDTWNRNNAPEGLQNHISIAAMVFKCHARLDTCVIITLRAQPCAFRHKHRSQLCFVGSNALQSQQKRPSVIKKKKKKPWRAQQSLHTTFNAKLPIAPFLFSVLSTFSSWQMIRRGTDHVEPNPSYLAEDHTDGPDRAS